MAETQRRALPGRPGFVVMQKVGERQWLLLGEADRKPGQSAKAARGQAIQDATGGKARRGEVYAAVLRSEWRIALDW